MPGKLAVILGIVGGAILLAVIIPRLVNRADLPEGETISSGQTTMSKREILITDGVKHSIPLEEVLAGGPPKDGIPSIDNPKFVPAGEADFLATEDVGLGLVLEGEARFYPYQILVWHEIVNDEIGGRPIVVTYCPLCATGIVFERKIDGETVEFGVSGQLWQSNLLMYNRTQNPKDESLWSQILGEAVIGSKTGARLTMISSDTVRWNDWSSAHPETRVLSRDTGASRPYGSDPYGDYYTSNFVGFGAEFADQRLDPKALVFGIEIDGRFKAYAADSIKPGEASDTFAGQAVLITKSPAGEVDFRVGGDIVSHIPSFWFSWLAVHPDTELFQ